ncbi:MAG: ABC transporter permease [Bacillota bacterium]|jgi:ABC-type dipeptide/oligopeptide/nickel transport system permease subunit|nr:ABC transporter permease [Bacillota bacterium]HHT90122.1 ABC transporter permease [Bacillota bacterium]
MKYLLRSKSALTGLILIGILVIVAIFADVLAPHDPYKMDIWNSYRAPEGTGGTYILGTDDMGRDVLSRILVGSRVSLLIAVTATGVSLVFGVALGAIAGYVGGKVDAVIMRIMDLILSFPSILLAIAIVATMGPGVINAMFAVAIVRIPAMTRVTRSMVLGLKEEEFVMAGVALGLTNRRILFRHILINSFAPILVVASLNMGTAITTEATLSFLGLGAQPPIISWGRMLALGREAIRTAPHLTLYPGLAIVFTVLGFNLLGDGLRDIGDPQLRGR